MSTDRERQEATSLWTVSHLEQRVRDLRAQLAAVARAEAAAAQGTALARRTPQPINVPPVQLDRRLLMSGETEQEDW